jgi:hypothetical protein
MHWATGNVEIIFNNLLMLREKQNSSLKNYVFKCKCYKQERKAQFWQEIMSTNTVTKSHAKRKKEKKK